VDKVICVSQGVAKVMRDTGRVPDEKIAVVPNGTDFGSAEDAALRHTTQSLRQALGLEGRVIVGTAGELSPHKGHEDFIRAAARVIEHNPEVAFVIAGEDPLPGKSYRAHLESLSSKLSLEKHIRLLGWIDDMLPFYQTLDLFVSAARMEPFGLVIVEAMASSTPAVIATATDGACEIIEDGVTGILVPVSDYEQLASAMRNLLVDVELRKDIVSRATKVAYERYSLDRMIEAVERIYRGI